MCTMIGLRLGIQAQFSTLPSRLCELSCACIVLRLKWGTQTLFLVMHHPGRIYFCGLFLICTRFGIRWGNQTQSSLSCFGSPCLWPEVQPLGLRATPYQETLSR